MKVTNIDSLNPFLKECYKIPIGKGTTAVCYLMKNGNVLKIFKDTYNTATLKRMYPNSIEHYSSFESIKNDSYISPDELLIINGQVIAYIYKYVNAKTFKKISYLTSLRDIFLSDAYKRLQENTFKASEKGFELYDSHDENILFDGTNFYNIDLDFSNVSSDIDIDKLYMQNIRTIQNAMIYSLFNIKSIKKYNLYFNDEVLDKLYNLSIYHDDNQIKQLVEELEKRNVKTKFDVRTKKHFLARVEYNDYYNRFF